jgi:hypothetical protein
MGYTPVIQLLRRYHRLGGSQVEVSLCKELEILSEK